MCSPIDFKYFILHNQQIDRQKCIDYLLMDMKNLHKKIRILSKKSTRENHASPNVTDDEQVDGQTDGQTNRETDRCID